MEITVVSNMLEAVSICIVASVQCSHFILDKSDQLLHVCVVFFFPPSDQMQLSAPSRPYTHHHAVFMC